MKAGVNAIIQKIHEDAERIAHERLSALTREADRHYDEDMGTHQRELKRHIESLTKQKQRELEVSLERRHNSLERDLLDYRHHLLGEIFGMAVAQLRDMPNAEFIRLFESAVSDLRGEYDLILGEHSAGRLGQRDVDRVTGERLVIRLQAEPRPGKSGFLLLNPNVEYNCFFEDLVDDLRERQTAVVLREVFDE